MSSPCNKRLQCRANEVELAEAHAEIQRLRHDIDHLTNTNANLVSEIEWLRVAVERKP